ncbi:MAG: shikimate dehydrogenase [Jatrophihabitans sp.]
MPVLGRAAVLGRPIAHSLSPVLHRAAYDALGLAWTYDAIDCGADQLGAVLAARAGWAGFSCTMPLKHAALDIAASVRPLAAAVGSANTLLPGPRGWLADNTDVPGIVAALREHGREAARTVTVLGAGGTAQAVLGTLRELGVPGCTVLVRDLARTDALRDAADRLGVEAQVRTIDVGEAALHAQLVVSTLPAGAADLVASRRWTPDQTVLDVVYAGWPTALARAAAGGGASVISGALLLLHQAAAQVELMTGSPAPVEAMRAALRAAVPDCGV